MKTVLVTGADGYLGKGIVERLLQAGYRVYALGFKPLEMSDENLIVVSGDVFDRSNNEGPLHDSDILLHLAWRDGFNHFSESHIDDLPKHYAFLEEAIDAGITQIAVMGSMHEVGYHEGEIDENTPCEPMSPYGIAKNALRQLAECLSERNDMILQWLRGFYIVDNTGRGHSIFSKIIEADKAGEKEFPFTSGKNKYDFIRYEDFCDQVVAVISQNAIEGVINVCSGKPIALGEYIESFIEQNSLDIHLAYNRFPDRPYDSPAIWGSQSKIESIIGEK